MPGAEKITLSNAYPCLSDWTETTPVNLTYLYQDAWGAEKVFKSNPKYHVDIGSTSLLVAILAKYTRVCSVDIRPLPVKMKNLEARHGDILHLPFKDGEIESLSSLCVLEHIGLGRYGDALDPQGTIKAAAEIERVMKAGGNFYVSTMIGNEGKVCFNGHRVFTKETFVDYFKNSTLKESVFVTEDRVLEPGEFEKLSPSLTVGLFHFVKNPARK